MGCSPWGREESDTTKRLDFHFSLSCIGEGNGNPLQYSCLETSQCDSEFEGGETTSHAEEFQVMCVDTMHQTGSTSPTPGRPCVVSPPGDGRRTGGKARLSREEPDQRFLSRLTPASSNVRKPQGQAGVTETALFCYEPLPGTHGPSATTAKTLDRSGSGAADSRPDLSSSEPPRSSETRRG